MPGATIQIFGIKNSQATRAAERFFKERSATIQSIDLKVKPMAPGEINRFIQRFGLAQLLDRESAAWTSAGLQYLRVTDREMLEKIEREPKLLRLPLVRSGNLLSIGEDPESWKAMLGKS